MDDLTDAELQVLIRLIDQQKPWTYEAEDEILRKLEAEAERRVAQR